ncbi:hypothetical protein NMG60_11031330 [Bertholletia excelsa]
MAVAVSLFLPHEWKIHSNCGYNNKPKANLSLFSATLSSHALRQDTWSHHLLNTVRRPKFPLPSRCNGFHCRSFLIANGGNGIPILRTAAKALTRSYGALQRSPFVLQLAPAVGLIAFAMWGLGPLMHLSRILFLNKSDDSWQRSGTHHVMTSYLQPMLLWTGATLICRSLDPIVLPTEASQVVKQRLLNFIRSLSTVLAFAYCLSSLIQQTQKFFMETNDSNDARNMGFQFAGKAVYTAVWVAAVSLFMELLGFSTQKWLTAGGSAQYCSPLLVIFTNFLSSIMIHATRPFVVNEWIQAKIEGYEVSGIVEHVGWWSPTIIRGDDREAIHIPNHKFTVNVVRNLSQKTHWRIKTHLAISHLDVNKINSIVADMRKVLAKNPQVEQQRLHRRVFLENINPENQALMILISCFVKTSHIEEYLCVKEAILLDLLRVISHHRARLATPIRTFQKIYTETEIESTAFAGSRAAGNRPLLLIEPSYKVNSEEKAKTPIRPARPNEVKDAKVEAATTSDSKIDVKGGSTSNPRVIKTDARAASETSSNANSNIRVSATSTSNPKNSDAESVCLVQDSEKRQIKKNASDGPKKDGEKMEIASTISHAKQDGEWSPSVSRPALEDNIVLGVALEGSKRTLPIEEEITPSMVNLESKELAASRNRSGSTAIGVDKKDDQIAATPGATLSNQRERER